MAVSSAGRRIEIPTELIGSLPRSMELVEARRTHKDGELTADQLALMEEKDLRNVLFELEQTGSKLLTDGELQKPSFLSYPIDEIVRNDFSFDEENLPSFIYADHHRRFLPRLIHAPFHYSTFAVDYLRTAQKYTKCPLKQSVIAPSTLSLVYTRELIENYSRQHFLEDLIDQAEKDIRLCLEAGAEKVQLDFPEAKLAFKWDETGKLFEEFLEINNRMLDRFNEDERKRLGVHICSGNDRGSAHSSDVDYSRVLHEIFRLHLNNFYLEMTSENDPKALLALIGKSIQPKHRIFIGVINPRDTHIETPEQVRDRILLAAKYIPINQLGTTDDCGFAPYNDNEFISREKAYEKIRIRIEGTQLAEQFFNQSS